MTPNLSAVIERTQSKLFGAEDTVCLERARLVTEADTRYADEPPPVRRALCFAHILRRMTLDLATNPVFAGNTSTAPRAWMLVPEFGVGVPSQVSVEHDHLAADWLDGRVPQEILDYWAPRRLGSTPGGPAGIGHMSIDFALVVNEGLDAVLTRLAKLEGQGTEEQRTYRRAMRIGCEAVIAWAERHADAAAERARTASDPVAAACHARVAEACRHVPRRAARNLFEGLQSMLLVHLATVVEGQGMSQSVGLSDRVLARFAAEAESDPEGAAQLVSAFLLGVAANSYLGRGSKTQAVTVGGADDCGRDRCNAVTIAFLEGFDRTPVGDPHLFLRWHRAIDPDVWARGLAMLSRGRSMPLLMNDHSIAPALESVGVAAADAWDYCIAGCNEIGIPGRCTTSAFSMGPTVIDVAVLRDALLDAPRDVRSMDDLLRTYETVADARLREGFRVRDRRQNELAERSPFAFTSACCRGSVEAGADYLVAMPYADIATVFVRGTTNAVNALAAMDHTVFREARLTVPALAAALEADDPAVLALLAAAPKWGNDDPDVDRWAVALHEARQRVLDRLAAERGQPIIVCHVIRSLHHVSGRPLGATPDGRRAHAPLADSVGAAADTAAEGPTAMLNSVLRIDAGRFYKGSYNLNLTLEGRQAAPATLDALCRAFFLDGGQELQVNVLDAATLRRAREHPEMFQNLVVRIAGLNARFVELSRLEQDELIRRAEFATA